MPERSNPSPSASAAKYIFVTGGVTSSLGKGIISASLAKLLQARGFRVTIQKFDPYINIDPGTLNPYEHGECYVTDDGAVSTRLSGLQKVLHASSAASPGCRHHTGASAAVWLAAPSSSTAAIGTG